MLSYLQHTSGTAWAVLIGGLILAWLASNLSGRLAAGIVMVTLLIFGLLTVVPGAIPVLQQHLGS